MKFALSLLFSIAPLQSWACISFTEHQVSYNILEKRDGNYIVERTSQEFDTRTKKPVGGIVKYQFVEDDFLALRKIIAEEIINKPEKADSLKAPLIQAMEGEINHLKKDRDQLIRTLTESKQSALNRMENSDSRKAQLVKADPASSVDETFRGLDRALALVRDGKLTEGIGAFEDARKIRIASFTINFTPRFYKRVGGGDPIHEGELFPPKNRSVGGCESSSTSIANLGPLIGADPARPVVAPDPLLGLGLGAREK